jgi:hypothetical protein
MAGTSPAKSPMIAAAAAPRLRPLDAGGHEAIPSRPRFDPHVAHPARVYNLWLGGKDGYAADREAAEQVARCRPQTVIGARANRAFLARVVRYLAGNRGVGQFVWCMWTTTRWWGRTLVRCWPADRRRMQLPRG